MSKAKRKWLILGDSPLLLSIRLAQRNTDASRVESKHSTQLVIFAETTHDKFNIKGKAGGYCLILTVD